MNCPICGSPTNDNEKYCSKCGAMLFKKCIKCGNELRHDEQFCTKCGTDNSEEAIAVKQNKKKKSKKKRKIIILILSSLVLIFIILQGISIIKALNHFKKIEPLSVMYCDGEDERTGMLHYTPALMYAVFDGFDYYICIKRLTSFGLPDNELKARIEKAVENEESDFLYYYGDDNLLFQSRRDDDEVRENPWLYSVYEDKIKFIKFGWFWDEENGEITLKSGHKLIWYWSQPFPFTFTGTVVIDGKELDR